MKKFLALVLCVAMLASLAGCGCKHQWIEANCLEAKTCSACGEIEGEALGHSWIDATCENSKTCSVCGLTEGEALDHDWLDATTEAPKTCALCAATEGERIITDERFTTDACEFMFGEWTGQMTAAASILYGDSIEGDLVFNVKKTFHNDGVVTEEYSFADWESAKSMFVDIVIRTFYMQYEMMGLDENAAQAAIQSEYGMTIEELAQTSVDALGAEGYSESASMVYYVENGFLYMAVSWDEEMSETTMTLDGDTLTLVSENGVVTTLTRVAP